MSFLCTNAQPGLGYSGRKSAGRRSLRGKKSGLRQDVRCVAALEFAILCAPFMLFLLGIFEISFDLYTQSALDSGLQTAARQIATGNAQNVVSTSDFITKYLCPDLHGLLACGSQLMVNVETVNLTASSDFYGATNYTGSLPITGNSLVVPASYGSFCNAGPNTALLVTAIYVGPTFIGGLLPGSQLAVYYGSKRVHATLSVIGLITENYTAKVAATGSTPAPAC